MNILLFSRPQVPHTPAELRRLVGSIEREGFDFSVNEEFARTLHQLAGIEVPAGRCYGASVGEQSGPAVMVCYGGDGTFLEGIRRLEGRPIPVIGINSGHLGFLASVDKSGVEEMLRDIRAGRLVVTERTMVEVAGDLEGSGPYMALNEVSIQRYGASMISVETYVDAQMVATYHGDGVILSTPTGSTAYSLSVGGPVVAPECACLIISPMAPHNLTMRPVVIPDSSEVLFRVRSRQPYAYLSLDNVSLRVREGAVLRVKKAERKIFLARRQNISFYDTLRNKMMWGMDTRDRNDADAEKLPLPE